MVYLWLVAISVGSTIIGLLGDSVANAAGASIGASCLVNDPTGTPLNVRASPQSTIVDTLPNGKRVSIQEIKRDNQAKTWARISRGAGGSLGWVFLDYLQCESDARRARSPSSAISYPVVFNKAQDLRRLGVVLKDYSTDSEAVQHYPNRCYYYGDGGYSLSVSDEFLAKFKTRGFSRRSLCMALVSQTRFDPETGRRLPTYIMGNIEALQRNRGRPGAGDVSEELPLDVPNCFKRGLPYSDCEMNYDPRTGGRILCRDDEKI